MGSFRKFENWSHSYSRSLVLLLLIIIMKFSAYHPILYFVVLVFVLFSTIGQVCYIIYTYLQNELDYKSLVGLLLQLLTCVLFIKLVKVYRQIIIEDNKIKIINSFNSKTSISSSDIKDVRPFFITLYKLEFYDNSYILFNIQLDFLFNNLTKSHTEIGTILKTKLLRLIADT